MAIVKNQTHLTALVDRITIDGPKLRELIDPDPFASDEHEDGEDGEC